MDAARMAATLALMLGLMVRNMAKFSQVLGPQGILALGEGPRQEGQQGITRDPRGHSDELSAKKPEEFAPGSVGLTIKV
eukprot:CAMPEP_0117477562 /NCGR_PEP_ID=MMETSP0784-20121206/10889_1 /TAXON_ID=39447 /ORGANISM="" /LENGTH=78 /DNA_ID=CAMNT_0005271873 /DNA_START=611 /DNA_END=847 /DNA_ORIENTATION=+